MNAFCGNNIKFKKMLPIVCSFFLLLKADALSLPI